MGNSEHADIRLYEKWARKAQEDPHILQRIRAMNIALVIIGYGAYALLLAYCFICAAAGLNSWHRLVLAILVPGISFVLVSVVRNLIDAPRPYEVYDIKPLISKDTHGKSMPSRHAFSMFMIAFSWILARPPVDVIAPILLIVLSCVLGYIRVLSGVHYTRDVVVSAVIALLCAFIGYVVI